MKTKLQKIREHHENFRKQAEEMGNLLRDQKMPELTEDAFLVYEKTGNRIRYENDYFSRRLLFGCWILIWKDQNGAGSLFIIIGQQYAADA